MCKKMTLFESLCKFAVNFEEINYRLSEKKLKT